MKLIGKIRKDSIWGKKVKFPGSFLGSSSHLVDETENLRPWGYSGSGGGKVRSTRE